MAAMRGCVAAIVVGVTFCGLSSAAWSQQKHQLMQTDSEGGYVQEHTIEVGDIPGHQVRVYQLKYQYPKKDLVFLGIPVKESTTAGMSDYTNLSGSFVTYSVYLLEDGNKIFARGSGSTQTASDGARRFSFVDNFVGGTGQFKGIRGQYRGAGERAAGAKTLTESQSGEYWIEP
jgi:hypothetical protein